jgi:hypothetical protein
MASLAGVLSRFLNRSAQAARSPAAPPAEDSRVPAFANDDIYFFVKRIDNSGVVRQADPAAGGACWKLIGSVMVASGLLVSVLLPGAYGLLAGYRIQLLRQEGQQLITEQASLELSEARLLSPARMEELARIQHFIDPGPQNVVYLEGEDSLALNQDSQAEK